MVTNEMMDTAILKMKHEAETIIMPMIVEARKIVDSLLTDERKDFIKKVYARYGRKDIINAGIVVHENDKKGLCWFSFSDGFLTSHEDTVGRYIYKEDVDDLLEWSFNTMMEEKYNENLKYSRVVKARVGLDKIKSCLSHFLNEYVPLFTKKFEEEYNKIVEIDKENTDKFVELFGVLYEHKPIHIEVKVTEV